MLDNSRLTVKHNVHADRELMVKILAWRTVRVSYVRYMRQEAATYCGLLAYQYIRKDGRTYATDEKLAQFCKVDLRTFKRHVRTLCKEGWLSRTGDEGRRWLALTNKVDSSGEPLPVPLFMLDHRESVASNHGERDQGMPWNEVLIYAYLLYHKHKNSIHELPRCLNLGSRTVDLARDRLVKRGAVFIDREGIHINLAWKPLVSAMVPAMARWSRFMNDYGRNTFEYGDLVDWRERLDEDYAPESPTEVRKFIVDGIEQSMQALALAGVAYAQGLFDEVYKQPLDPKWVNNLLRKS